MQMMRVPECLRSLEGQITEGMLRYWIRVHHIKSVSIGGVLMIDHDEVVQALGEYIAQRQYPGGLVTAAELSRRTHLTRHQIAVGVDEGWITPVERGKRLLYDAAAVEDHVAQLFEKAYKRGGGDEL